MELNEMQIRYGFDYSFEEGANKIRSVIETGEFNGEDKLVINCTQLGDIFSPQYKTQGMRKKVLASWCDFLQSRPEAFTELYFPTRMPQELFNAVCCQKNLKRLEIKWGVYQDISAIENLSKLELLDIGSGAGIKSIEPLSRLKNLIGLSVENFQKINDYSCLSALKKLESLSICGDGMSHKYIKIRSLDFLKEMGQLRFFSLLIARLESKSYAPVLKLIDLENLSLPTQHALHGLYNELSRLPKLKWGLLKEKPELYE